MTLTNSGAISVANLTYNNAAYSNPGLPYFNQIPFSAVYNGLSQNYLTGSSGSGQIAFYFNTTSDASGFYDLCIGSAQCGTSSGTVAPTTLQLYGFYNSASGTSNSGLSTTNFVSGYLTSGASAFSSVTPEPASLILLGTGAIGFAGAAGRRLWKGPIDRLRKN